MASFSSSVPQRTRVFVCDTCRGSLRQTRHGRFAATRTITTASSQPRRHGRPRPVHDPTPRYSSYQSLISRTYSSAIHLPSTGAALLSHRRLLSLSGPDAAKFLQGLITNNVDPQNPISAPFYSAFLDARGRVLWDVFIWVYPELVAEKGAWACYIEVDGGEAESLKKHLKRHKLRSKIEIKDAEEELGIWAAWGDVGQKLDAEAKGVVVSMWDPRGPGLWRGLVKSTDPAFEEGDVVGEEQYRIQRYTLGIPEGPLEIPRESALPMEHNIDLSQGIDFKKGCYVGQELTIRTKHTGVVRKRVLPVTLYTPASDAALGSLSEQLFLVEPATDIKPLDSSGELKKGRAAGKFIAGVGNIGLALCRLESMTPMKISAEGGTWKPGAKFGMASGKLEEAAAVKREKVVEVRPTLHDWFLVRERNLWDKNRTRI